MEEQSDSDVFSSSAGGGNPGGGSGFGHRLTSESESDWSSAQEAVGMETAGDRARMRILELQQRGVDLPAYTRQTCSGDKGVSAPAPGSAAGASSERGPLQEPARALQRPRRRTKVLSKEQKQLKRLRRRKRELEAMVNAQSPSYSAPVFVDRRFLADFPRHANGG